MNKNSLSGGLLEIYNRKFGELDLFKIKPWEVEIGQQMVLRPLEEIRAVETGLFDARLAKFEYDAIKDKVFTVTENMLGLIELHRKTVVTVNDINICLFMLQYADASCEKPMESDKVYSIKQIKKHQSVMEEMKSKVDRKRLQKLLSVSASAYGEKNFVSSDKLEEYLDLWAYAKYEYYLLFGNQLSIEASVEQPMTKKEMISLLVDLKVKYPKYGPWIDMFDASDYVSNSIGYVSSSVFKYASYCSTGMKLSGFFSKLLNDKDFDLDLSKVLQNKFVKGFVTISIDPYDYLTSSINQHDWRSCHRITDGEWGTGSLSYLLDHATLVAYKHSGKQYDYDLFGFKFSGNSKSFRQCIYFDKSSCNMLFGRTYPSASRADDIVCETVRELLFRQIENYFDLCEPQKWLERNNYMEGSYEDICELHYSDIENGYDFRWARLLNSKPDIAEFEVGFDVPCLLCGDDVTSSGPNGLCSCCDIED